MKEALTPLDQLKSVLCDPEGKCCIAGSAEDRETQQLMQIDKECK